MFIESKPYYGKYNKNRIKYKRRKDIRESKKDLSKTVVKDGKVIEVYNSDGKLVYSSIKKV